MEYTTIQADLEQSKRPRGETLFPGITRHAQTLKTNRSHLHEVLVGNRKSRSLIQRYVALLKKEGRSVPQLPIAA